MIILPHHLQPRNFIWVVVVIDCIGITCVLCFWHWRKHKQGQANSLAGRRATEQKFCGRDRRLDVGQVFYPCWLDLIISLMIFQMCSSGFSHISKDKKTAQWFQPPLNNMILSWNYYPKYIGLNNVAHTMTRTNKNMSDTNHHSWLE